jgi:hypothetical protein
LLVLTAAFISWMTFTVDLISTWLIFISFVSLLALTFSSDLRPFFLVNLHPSLIGLCHGFQPSYGGYQAIT